MGCVVDSRVNGGTTYILASKFLDMFTSPKITYGRHLRPELCSHCSLVMEILPGFVITYKWHDIGLPV